MSNTQPAYNFSDASNYNMDVPIKKYQYDNISNYNINLWGSISAVGYCNLLLDSINDTSTNKAPTANALNQVNNTSIFSSNYIVNTINSAIIFSSNNTVATSNNYYGVGYPTIITTQNTANATSNNFYGINVTFKSNVIIPSNLQLNSLNAQMWYNSNMVSYVNPGTISGLSGVSFRIRNVDPINNDCRFSLGSTNAASNYVSRMAFYTLGVLEQTSNYERFEVQATSNGANLLWSSGGNGSNKPLTIYNSNVILPNGSFNTANINIVNNASSNMLTLDCKSSTTQPAQIIFTNSAGTGDFRIAGDGGDLFWQGGGGRVNQMGAYHAITLYGGRANTSMLPYQAGSGSTFNTIIQNTQNSIALTIQGVANQTNDLMQFKNSSGTVITRFDSNGKLFNNIGTAPTAGNMINTVALSNPVNYSRTQYSNVYTPTLGTNSIYIYVQGGGGGGGAATGTSSAGGGGGCGGLCLAFVNGITNTGYNCVIGSAGAGGSNGGNTLITINNTVYMGIGGGAGAIGSLSGGTLGGVGGGQSNGIINITSESGGAGFASANPVYYSGKGGNGRFGQGGETLVAAGNGSSATGFGAGGGGAAKQMITTTGGSGANGLIMIEEYT